ncbi:MAG: hypothetical protein ACPKPY_10850 [Nitrososphaeraceae archaeon]
MNSQLENWKLDCCLVDHGITCKRKWTNRWIDHEILCFCSCHICKEEGQKK